MEWSLGYGNWHSTAMKVQRCAFIPRGNEGNDKRPITIAQAAWRCCATATVRNLADRSAFGWVHETAVGGSKGRDGDDLRARFHRDVDLASQEDEPWNIIAAHIDKTKCFDNIDIVMATYILGRLGLPRTTVELIRDF